ncbi:lytic transglycosylase domain-containing protein [Shewanella saliphila]|uniref:lytic transglycosylase domain-containing protein n=1 Tax=Shewanella saliphila TaxID=2282698 RepID=UPI00357166C0
MLAGVTAQAKQVVYPEVEDVVKPQIKAKYIEEQPELKPQRSLLQTTVSKPTLEPVNVINLNPVKSLNDQLVLDNSYVSDKSKPRTLTNDYPLKKSAVTPNKPRVKAQYSENGIVSDLGVEKRKVYQYKQANGIMVFSDHQPQGEDYQVLLYECFACRPDSTVDWYKIPLFTSHFATDVALAAHKYQLDPALIRAVIHAESAFKPRAVSKAGAKGLMQLMPGTASDMGVDNPLNAQQNIRGGSRYLAQLLAQFNGDLDLACAAYNAGPSTVTQYSGIPPYPETQAYVKRVKILFKRYQKALAS